MSVCHSDTGRMSAPVFRETPRLVGSWHWLRDQWWDADDHSGSSTRDQWSAWATVPDRINCGLGLRQ